MSPTAPYPRPLTGEPLALDLLNTRWTQEVLSAAPDRIRGCAQETCVLHFFDTSRNGTRRWCSMAVCGNRAKASRHYARAKDA
ncbi:CGNR zinc finger domain-containing protein [Streptomyces sp. MBT49]|nr:CGNR zinc finger domain-containing protein [Streptomyces sp. MBT49]MBK3630046.1 CGNR zinc finger domain-containing protein [Streptomyces sp. MBT49]